MTLPYDENNIFAKILRNEIPSICVYEDETTVAFMDLMPQEIGHTLVIPRKPSRNLLDAAPETLTDIIRVVQKISKASKKAFDSDGITVMQFNEAASGQTIYHLHFHIIPCFDNTPLKYHANKIADKVEIEKAAKKIRSVLRKI
ncbi:MAG: histidine triad (HIT) family protein [Candidatus Tokpelaia sp. JSC188]|nr:MAG: histidine triad (HIT) family protein [Candidatus Tokpelaia sp. JSC188]